MSDPVGGCPFAEVCGERDLTFDNKATKAYMGLLAIDVDHFLERLTGKECVKEVDDFAKRLNKEWTVDRGPVCRQ